MGRIALRLEGMQIDLGEINHSRNTQNGHSPILPMPNMRVAIERWVFYIHN